MKAQDLYKITHDACVTKAEIFCFFLRIRMWRWARKGYCGADRRIDKMYSDEFMEVCAPRLREEGYTITRQVTRETEDYDLFSIDWRAKEEKKAEE